MPKPKRVHSTALLAALERAKQLAKEEPRVAAVARVASGYVALPGFMDEDSKTFAQILLVTPDGRVWECHEPASLTPEEADVVYPKGPEV